MNTGRYVMPDVSSEILATYRKLSAVHKKEMVELWLDYMEKIEKVQCPTCKTSTVYDASNMTCVRCGWHWLEHLCKETVESEGWADGK